MKLEEESNNKYNINEIRGDITDKIMAPVINIIANDNNAESNKASFVFISTPVILIPLINVESFELFVLGIICILVSLTCSIYGLFTKEFSAKIDYDAYFSKRASNTITEKEYNKYLKQKYSTQSDLFNKYTKSTKNIIISNKISWIFLSISIFLILIDNFDYFYEILKKSFYV